MKKKLAILFATVIFLGFTALVVWGASFRLNVYNDAIFDGPEAKNPAPMLTTTKFWFNLQRWDAGWFKQIVNQGYDDASAAFFPLYPVLVKGLVIFLPDNTDAFPNAAFLISIVVILAAAWGTLRLAEIDKVPEPRLAIFLLLIFPTSFFLAAPYSEGLFIALFVWYLVAVQQKYWWLGISLGILLGLTRINALAVAIVPFYFLIKDWRHSSVVKKSGYLALMLAPAIGLGIFAVYLQFNLGDPLAFLHAHAKWGRVSNFSLAGLQATALRDWVDMTGVSAFHPRFTVGIINYGFTLFGLGMVGWFWFTKNRLYAYLALAFMIIPLASGTVSSMPRIVLPLSPLLAISLAKKITSPIILGLVIVLSVLVWTFLLILFTRQYWVA